MGDDIEFYTDESRSQVLTTWYGMRQQTEKQAVDGVLRPSRCLSDFVASKESGIKDYAGLFAVTAGIGAEKKDKEFQNALDDYSGIMFKALADRLAEAFAECLHARVRKDLWGYAEGEALSNEDLIKEKYQGIRPAPGYPACPDHTAKIDLFKTLNAEEIGMTLTDSLAMNPASSVSGFYIGNPEASYFNVGQIGEDQLADMAAAAWISKSCAVIWHRIWVDSGQRARREKSQGRPWLFILRQRASLEHGRQRGAQAVARIRGGFGRANFERALHRAYVLQQQGLGLLGVATLQGRHDALMFGAGLAGAVRGLVKRGRQSGARRQVAQRVGQQSMPHLFGQADMEIREQEGAHGTVHARNGFLFLGDMAAQLGDDTLQRLARIRNMPVSIMRRAEKASLASAAEGWTTSPCGPGPGQSHGPAIASTLRAPRCG